MKYIIFDVYLKIEMNEDPDKMKNTKEIQIYGRSRKKFSELFPSAKFEGYECNIRFCYFSGIRESVNKIIQLCKSENITIIQIK